MHRTLKKHATRPPQATLQAQQHCFNTFRHEFNTLRPHQALGDDVPADWFAACDRVT
jgi:transposase InsO family protein